MSPEAQAGLRSLPLNHKWQLTQRAILFFILTLKLIASGACLSALCFLWLEGREKMNRGLEFEPVACSVHNPVHESRLETPAGGFYKARFQVFSFDLSCWDSSVLLPHVTSKSIDHASLPPPQKFLQFLPQYSGF